MGRRGKNEPPVMRLHRASGNARVRIDGKDIYLGRYGSEEARTCFLELLGKWLAENQDGVPTPQSAAVSAAPIPAAVPVPAGDSPTQAADSQQPPDGQAGPLIGQLLVLYYEHAQQKYRDSNGQPTSTIFNIRMAMQALSDFRHVPAAEFTVEMFDDMLRRLEARPRTAPKKAGTKAKARPLLRQTINRTGKFVKQFFRWATKYGHVPAEVSMRLAFAEPLARGRTTAPESRRVLPVADEVVAETLPHLPRMLADMVRIQRLIGCRPGELCKLRPKEIAVHPDSPDVHIWTPEHHKTSWRDHDRQIQIGPRAFAILEPYLDRRPDDYCFQPAESEAQRNKERRQGRTSKMTPSHRLRRDRARKKPVSHRPYNEKVYAKAIKRACEINGIPHWTPNQLRHSLGTEARKREGLDVAQVLLGHRRAEVTQRYASPSDQQAVDYARQYG